MVMKEDITLLQGEQALPGAPLIKLTDGRSCIPQHYLQFQHTRETVEALILDIEFSPAYPIFVCAGVEGIYLQVGIIGPDNYRPASKQKIVYGRKWRVEPQLPSSEIIQTAFLALQKAREHEVRELFSLNIDGVKTTPFNNHQDLPLIAQLGCELTETDDTPAIEQTFGQFVDNISYNKAKFEVVSIEERSFGNYLIDLFLQPSKETYLPELVGKEPVRISLLLDSLSISSFMYALMDSCLNLSNRYVEDHFSYRGFQRFSRKNDIMAIGRLSALARERERVKVMDQFTDDLEQANYDTDTTRVPTLNDGLLSQKIQAQLSSFGELEGILPLLP